MSSPGRGRRRWAAKAGHGMLALRRAPSSGWRATRRPGRCRSCSGMTSGGKLNEGIFRGETINTPSMLCVEDALNSLKWAEAMGGLDGAGRPRRGQPGGGARGSSAGRGRASWPRTRRPAPAPRSSWDHRAVVHRAAADEARFKIVRSMTARLEAEGAGLRPRQPPRLAAGHPHLGRRHGRAQRCRGVAALARLGLGRGARRRQGGLRRQLEALRPQRREETDRFRSASSRSSRSPA